MIDCTNSKVFSPLNKTSVRVDKVEKNDKDVEFHTVSNGKFGKEIIKASDGEGHVVLPMETFYQLVFDKIPTKKEIVKEIQKEQEIKTETSEDEVDEDVSEDNENSFDNEGNKFITKRKR